MRIAGRGRGVSRRSETDRSHGDDRARTRAHHAASAGSWYTFSTFDTRAAKATGAMEAKAVRLRTESPLNRAKFSTRDEVLKSRPFCWSTSCSKCHPQ